MDVFLWMYFWYLHLTHHYRHGHGHGTVTWVARTTYVLVLEHWHLKYESRHMSWYWSINICLLMDTFTKLRGSLFSRFRVQIAAAIAKAAAARFVPDSTNDGIPTFVVWDRGRKPLTNSAPEDDLPLYHIPCT
jgi:hypothetical protein